MVASHGASRSLGLGIGQHRGKRMVRPTHIAVLLIAACLAGCGGYNMFDPESTASFSGSQPGQASPITSSDRANTAALTSLFNRAAEGKPDADPAAPPPA